MIYDGYMDAMQRCAEGAQRIMPNNHLARNDLMVTFSKSSQELVNVFAPPHAVNTAFPAP
jgi:hypothetical protein